MDPICPVEAVPALPRQPGQVGVVHQVEPVLTGGQDGQVAVGQLAVPGPVAQLVFLNFVISGWLLEDIDIHIVVI